MYDSSKGTISCALALPVEKYKKDLNMGRQQRVVSAGGMAVPSRAG